TGATTFELPPGRYAILDLIPGADGVPHVVKGMYRELIVVPSHARHDQLAIHPLHDVRHADGRSADDLLRWLSLPAGSPPGEMLGGVFGLKTGERAFVTLDLTPGRYALFCSLGGGPGVAPWYARGMLRELEVR
ncbi:MAG TPA: hypothetical protein VMS45_05840, partial [Gemmatimonadaceae bacterium]|nr:hypothetical protein [Gemmatimonadaceae bacterium]